MVPAQQVRQLRAGQPGGRAVHQDLAPVQPEAGRAALRRVRPAAQHPQPGKPGDGGVEPVQPAGPGREPGVPVGGQQAGAAVQRGHQRVGGGAGLEHVQLALHLAGQRGAVPPAQVQKRRLGQAGQRLVGALHHNVRPAGQRAAPPAVGPGQRQVVGAVGLVHQQRHAAGVAEAGDRRDIAQNALVGGAGQDHAGGLRAGVQRGGHVLRGDAAVDAEGPVRLWHDPAHPQVPQLDGVEHRFVAVAGGDDGAARGGQRPDARQQPHGGPVDQVKGPGRAPQPGGALHGLGQDARGAVQVVGAVDLGQVPVMGQAGGGADPALVAGHVQRGAGGGKRGQLRLQNVGVGRCGHGKKAPLRGGVGGAAVSPAPAGRCCRRGSCGRRSAGSGGFAAPPHG